MARLGQYHAIPYKAKQYHAIPYKTRNISMARQCSAAGKGRRNGSQPGVLSVRVRKRRRNTDARKKVNTGGTWSNMYFRQVWG